MFSVKIQLLTIESKMENQFVIQLASQKIEVSCLHEFTHNLCNDYEIQSGTDNSVPDFSIDIKQEDIYFERNRADREYKDDYIESLAVYRKICDKIADYGIILMHGSAISVETESGLEAVLFIAPSGTGKSTHTRFWKALLGDRVQYINDDKPLIDSNTMQIYGTPWDGKHRLSTNISVKLRAICILERGENNSIEEIQAQDILGDVIRQTYRPEKASQLASVLEALNKIVSNVEFYRIKCLPNRASAEIAYKHIFDDSVVYMNKDKDTLSYEELLERDGEFVYKACGTSMMPMIEPGKDMVYIKKRPYNSDGSFAPLKKNDVVLYKRGEKYVLHRVANVFGNGEGRNYITYGDNNRRLEYGIRDEQIIGVLDKVIKGGKEIDPKSIRYTSTILWILRKLL